MKVTEKQAAEIICHRSLPLSVRNRNLCLGSKCMAWRWWGWETPVENTSAIVRATKRPIGESSADRLGYCGLAGSVANE